MQVTVLNEIPVNRPEISIAWNKLVSGMERPEIFLTYEWAMASSQSFSQSFRPLLFLMYEGDQLCGVAALATDPQRPRAAFFLTGSTADYSDVLSAPEARRKVLGALLEEIKKLEIRDLALANLPSDSATFRELPDAARASGFHLGSRVAYECGIVELGGEEQRQALICTVARKEREKRGLKKLAGLGSVGLSHITSVEQLGTTLDVIFSAHVARFLASGRVSPLLHPDRRAFLKQLADIVAAAGWLKISQLEVDGRAIAWNYGFRFGDSLFWYLPTFRIEHENASPGSCLLRLLVEESCADRSLQRLDLGLGDESYKERFANARRQTCYVELSRSLTRHATSAGRQLMVRTAARDQRIERSLRQVRDILRASTTRVRETGLVPTMRHAARRTAGSLLSRQELIFFEAPAQTFVDGSASQLTALTWQHLSETAMVNADDAPTLGYLMRCAKRLKQGAAGLVMRGPSGAVVHLLWVGNYQGFHVSEIDHVLSSPDATAAMIFDCWTPASHRGCGYYTTAIRLAAADLQRQGRKAWIFTATANSSSLRGISKAGFVCRFSLVRRNQLGHSTVTRSDSARVLSDQA